MEEEVWKKIEEFPNYSVSSYGNVRNDLTGKILKPRLHTHGYHRICLRKNNDTYIHRLVATAFCENENKYEYVDHRDHNKTNNHYTNLRWVSRSQNMQNVRKREGTSSRYIGIDYNQRDKCWRARISVNEKSIHLGSFKTEEEAKIARRTAIIHHNLQDFYPADEL